MPSLSKILLPVDFSERSPGAARYAKTLADRYDSEIVVLHVVTPVHYEFGALEGCAMLGEIYTDRYQQAEDNLQHFLEDELAGPKVRRVLLEGDASGRIVEFAHAEQVNLIVMPTHGYGKFRRFILGSNTARVLHEAECPVWTGVHMQDAPAAAPIGLRNILCAIDLGPQSCRTLTWAGMLQRDFGANLTVIHALAFEDESAELELSIRSEVKRFEKSAGVEAAVLLQSGDAAETVCAAAQRLSADLLVIGRGSSAGGFGRLRTHADAIIRQSPCPVVSV